MLLARTTLAAESALATSPVTSIGKALGQSGRACDAAPLDPQIRQAMKLASKKEMASSMSRSRRRIAGPTGE
jgi:hypothetical protein